MRFSQLIKLNRIYYFLHTTGLFDVIETIKPGGGDEWELVRDAYNRKTNEDRDVSSIRIKFNSYLNAKPQTGTTEMPPLARSSTVFLQGL